MGNNRAEQKAQEYEKSLDYYHYTSDNPSVAYQKGYEQALEDVLVEIGRRDSEIPRRYFSKPSDYTLYTNRAKVEAYGELKACIELWIKSTDERESVSGEN